MISVIVIRGINAARRWFELMPQQPSCCQSFDFLQLAESHGGGLERVMRMLRQLVKRMFGRTFDCALGWDGETLKAYRDLQSYVVVRGDRPILIAPLWICNENDRCVFGSAEEWDSVDFIYGDYPQEELQDAFDTLLSHLAKEGCNVLHWCFLHETSVTTKLLQGYPVSLRKNFVNTSIRIAAEDHNSYLKTLGKHAAQNLRTAYNRVSRDGHAIRFEFTYHPSHVPMEVKNLYAVRQAERYRGQARPSIRDRVRWCLFNGSFRLMASPIGFLARLKIDGRIAAFMGGMVNQSRKMLEVPKLAIDIAYKFYSPGLLLMNEMIRFMIEKADLTTLNMGRGAEKYKIDMGGGTSSSLKLDVDLTKGKLALS